MNTLILLVSNLHCPSCVSHVEYILSQHNGIKSSADVSLIKQTISVKLDHELINYQSIIEALNEAAFDIRHVTLIDNHSHLLQDYEVAHGPSQQQQAPQKHIETCHACQEKHTRNIVTPNTYSNSSDKPTVIAVDETSRENDLKTYTMLLGIEGMTCGTCVGAITSGLQELSFVSDVNVDLLSNSASLKFIHRENIDTILEKIDDLGYSGTVLNIRAESDDLTRNKRIIELQIEGMHCAQCPSRVLSALEISMRPESVSKNDFEITSKPTLEDPRVQISYIPSTSKGLNIRQFISIIRAVDSSFKVSVYHPPTLEERSKKLQHKERLEILQRMIFTGIVSIPSFIVGVVFMALVPASNATRQWFEQPVWAGNATRIEWTLFIITTPVMFFGADLFHRRAFKEIWAMWKPGSKTPILRRLYRFGSMNMLISVGTMVAFFSSLAILIMNATNTTENHHRRMPNTYFDVITFLTFFILIGKYLEAYSKVKTGDAVAMLGQLQPQEATLVEDDRAWIIPVDQLEIGDVVRVTRGRSPPADGIIEQDGTFSFDESSLTGESKPVRKTRHDKIFTGTINIADPVLMKVTEVGGVSMLDQIIQVVREGQAKRAPIERYADLLTGYFVPTVTLIAILTWLIWLALGLSGSLPEAWLDSTQGGWGFWSLEFAIAVFVIACPCGIGLAAPTALFVGSGLAAKQGILVQGGGQAFQEASKLDGIVFDKTGTLTQGRMQVTEYISLSDKINQNIVLAICRAVESLSSHPIAQAITVYCNSSSEEIEISDVREVPGQGMTAIATFGQGADKQALNVAVGNQSLLQSLNQSPKDNIVLSVNEEINGSIKGSAQAQSSGIYLQQHLYRLQSLGYSTAIFAVRQMDTFEPVAVFGLTDPLRSEAVEVMHSLRASNISIYVCTGDNATTAMAIASQLDIPPVNVRAGVLPQGKADFIRELQNPANGKRKVIAFVGDGLNDTAALSASDVSISMSSGSDIAINASSFVLLHSHLSAVHTLVTLSKRVFRRVKINFFWAGIYNIILIPVAAGVFFKIGATEDKGGFRLSPVWAAVAMAGSSVSVVLSSLALKLKPHQ